MRVLMLAQFYPPDIGGEERHVRNLAIALSARGHQVDVVTSALPETGAGQFVEDGINIHRVRTTAQRLPVHQSPSRPHATPFPDLAMQNAIDSHLSTGQYDVIHTHNWIVNSALLPAEFRGVPVVLTLHDYSHVCATKLMFRNDEQCAGPSPIRCVRCAAGHYGAVMGPVTATANVLMLRRRRKSIAHFIAVSSAIAQNTGLIGGAIPYEVIPNFIPDSIVEDLPPQFDGPIVFAGDVTRPKGVLTLLDAYRLLKKPAELHLIGRVGSDVNIADSGGVRVLGPMAHSQLMKHFASAQMVVVPSIWSDSCPTVVLEAMAKGRPVVASAVGGIVDMVVNGKTGFLVHPDDPTVLSRAISKLLDDRELAAACGKSSLEHVRQFLASSVIDRIEGVYEKVIVMAMDR